MRDLKRTMMVGFNIAVEAKEFKVKERLATFYVDANDEVVVVDEWTRRWSAVNRSETNRVSRMKRTGDGRSERLMNNTTAWKTYSEAAQIDVAWQLRRDIKEDDDTPAAPKVLACLESVEGDLKRRVFGKEPENACQSFQTKRGN